MSINLRIHIVGDLKSDWYPKNAIEMFKKYSEFEFVDSPDKAHIIWIFSYSMNLNYLKLNTWKNLIANRIGLKKSIRRSNQLIICSFHHLYKPKEEQYLQRVINADNLSDVIHFFSYRNAVENQGYFKNPIFISPYWIETNVFTPLSTETRQSLKSHFNIPKNKIVVGSFQRDTENDLLSPKLEKGPDIFCDVMENLDSDRFFVLLAGPRRHYVANRLNSANIPFIQLGKVPHTEMNNLYNTLDYYLVTSRIEGGPQAILESMASKTSIYSTPVGISDLLDNDVVIDNSIEIAKALNHNYPNVKLNHIQTAEEYSAPKIIRSYENIFGELYDAKIKQPTTFHNHTKGIEWLDID